MERIKFYSKSDLGCSYNLEKLYEIVMKGSEKND